MTAKMNDSETAADGVNKAKLYRTLTRMGRRYSYPRARVRKIIILTRLSEGLERAEGRNEYQNHPKAETPLVRFVVDL